MLPHQNSNNVERIHHLLIHNRRDGLVDYTALGPKSGGLAFPIHSVDEFFIIKFLAGHSLHPLDDLEHLVLHVGPFEGLALLTLVFRLPVIGDIVNDFIGHPFDVTHDLVPFTVGVTTMRLKIKGRHRICPTKHKPVFQ